MVLHGIMDSLMQHGAKRFVILNGHGGNTPSIDRAALEVYHKGGVCASVDWWSLGSSAGQEVLKAAMVMFWRPQL